MRDALYLRVSQEAQAAPERYSIPVQERDCRAHSERTGGQVVRIFTDEGASAFRDEIEHRPALQQAMEAAERGEYDRLIVHLYDRFARNTYVAHLCLRRLEKAKVKLESALEFSDETPAGIFYRNISFAQSEYYSHLLSERISRALQEKLRRGGWIGRVPYGYSSKDGKLSVEKSEAEGYRFAVRAALEGAASFSELTRMMNAAGYKTKKGRLWRSKSVAEMLKSPAYLGMVLVGKGGERAVLPGNHKPLIDREEWDHLQVIIDRWRWKRASWSRRAKSPYPLTGVIRCARCGGSMVGSTRAKQTIRAYLCSNHKLHDTCDQTYLHAEACERAVAELLDSLTLPSNWREALECKVTRPQQAVVTEAQIEEEERKLTLMYQQGYIRDFETFKGRWDTLQEQRAELQPPPPAEVVAVGELLEQGIGRLWRDSPDQRARRALVRAIFEAIYVDGRTKEVEITRVEWRKAAKELLRG